MQQVDYLFRRPDSTECKTTPVIRCRLTPPPRSRPCGATVTSHRCKHKGYDEFDPPSWDSECAPNKTVWIPEDDRLCGEGGFFPEVSIRVGPGNFEVCSRWPELSYLGWRFVSFSMSQLCSVDVVRP